MKYVELFRLALEHGYYPDLRCPDFQIEAGSKTQKFLKDLRAQFQPFPGEIRVLIPTDNNKTPFIRLPAFSVFTFHLRLENPNFSLFTDMSTFNKLAKPHYVNVKAKKKQALKLVSQLTKVTDNFTVRNPSENEQFSLSGRPQPYLRLTDFVVTGLGLNSGLNSYTPSTRTFMLKTQDFPVGEPFTITYPVMSSLQPGVFADIEIKLDTHSAKLPRNAFDFKVVFKPKEARWIYYVITNKSENKTVVPTIKDKDQEILFNDEERIDLTQTPDAADEIALGLASQYPDKQIFRLASSTLIPCRRGVRKNIQFYLDGHKVLDALPNPILQNSTILTKNRKKEFALYHIVKYFTH